MKHYLKYLILSMYILPQTTGCQGESMGNATVRTMVPADDTGSCSNIFAELSQTEKTVREITSLSTRKRANSKEVPSLSNNTTNLPPRDIFIDRCLQIPSNLRPCLQVKYQLNHHGECTELWQKVSKRDLKALQKLSNISQTP